MNPDWSISRHGTSPRMVWKLGRMSHFTPVAQETHVSASMLCPMCGDGQVDVDATLTGCLDDIKFVGVGCTACDKTFTLEWSAKGLTVEELNQ